MNKEQKQLFAKEVKAGLTANEKWLSSKWFYDERGDELFVQIMNLPEYYLTDCEFEILSKQAPSIIDATGFSNQFEIFELGAGDGVKTIELLRSIQSENFIYRPIDISSHAIQNLTQKIATQFGGDKVKGVVGEYFEALNSIESTLPKLILFLGSNIGNLSDQKANDFLKQLAEKMAPGDAFLLGVDLIKPEHVVLPAYNDREGVTAQFNKNVLHRINKELGGNFNVNAFEHQPEYSIADGEAKSYLVAKSDQNVSIGELDLAVSIKAGERIFTEVSRKHDKQSLSVITKDTGLQEVKWFTDKRNYFADILYQKV